MTEYSQKTIDAAIKADLNARRYVMIERLKMATTYEDLMEVMNHLDVIEHRIECNNIRDQLNCNTHMDNLAHQWRRAAREVSATKTHR